MEQVRTQLASAASVISHKTTGDSYADGLLQILVQNNICLFFNYYSEVIWGYTVDIDSAGGKTRTLKNFRVSRKSNTLLDNSNTVNAWPDRHPIRIQQSYLKKKKKKHMKLTFIQMNTVQHTRRIKPLKTKNSCLKTAVNLYSAKQFKTLTIVSFKKK